jgi:hypothetical protein
MNALSWLIYLVGMITNLSAALGVILGVSIFLCIAILIFKAIAFLSANDSWKKEALQAEDYIAWQKQFSKYFKWVFSIFVVSLFLTIFVPERQTMIMIAASEVSERVIKTETMQSALNDVSGLSGDAVELLKEYIKSETDKIKKSVIPETKPETKKE